MTRSLLLGIDVSPKRLGYGLVDLVTGEPVACGMEPIDLPHAGWHHQQVQRALGVIDPGGPGGPDDFEIQAVFIEDTAGAGKFRQHDAGRAQGMVQAEVERRWPWVTVQFLKPSEWKKLAGLKGNASKEEVYLRALDLGFGVEQPGDQSRVLEWVVPGGQDAADAGCIAVAGQRRNQESWDRGNEEAA